MTPAPRILIIDDEKTFRVVAQAALAAEGFEARSAASGGEGVALARELRPEVVVLDRNLPDADGLAVLEKLLAEGAGDAPLVVMATAYGEIENAVQAVKLGAFDYLTKPIQLAALVLTVKKALEARRLQRRADGLVGRPAAAWERGALPGRVGGDAAVWSLREGGGLARHHRPVQGESGTGKELVAARHARRRRRAAAAPFVELNCAAAPRDAPRERALRPRARRLHRRQARRKRGLFEEADGGTLFLDEIGELPLGDAGEAAQVLEDARRSGASAASGDAQVDVRFVAATNRDLEATVAAGSFRLDLFYRLDVFRSACRRSASGRGRAAAGDALPRELAAGGEAIARSRRRPSAASRPPLPWQRARAPQRHRAGGHPGSRAGPLAGLAPPARRRRRGPASLGLGRRPSAGRARRGAAAHAGGRRARLRRAAPRTRAGEPYPGGTLDGGLLSDGREEDSADYQIDLARWKE